jgi:hypothetical protein
MGVNLALATSEVDVNFLQSASTQSSILTEIYQPQYNICIWQRRLPTLMTDAINDMLQTRKPLALVQRVRPDNTAEYILDKLAGFSCVAALSEDIALIVDMFCCLFGVEEAGLRLSTLDSAMCPRFHVDQIPCRLVTTYTGSATQWLKNTDVDRRKLGRGSVGVADNLSGLFNSDLAVKKMHSGDIALLKGSGWKGNESMGLVHRSPELMLNERRLLLTLDLV